MILVIMRGGTVRSTHLLLRRLGLLCLERGFLLLVFRLLRGLFNLGTLHLIRQLLLLEMECEG